MWKTKPKCRTRNYAKTISAASLIYYSLLFDAVLTRQLAIHFQVLPEENARNPQMIHQYFGIW